jgi:hypothetical protein
MEVNKMVDIQEVQSKAKIFLAGKFQYTLSEDKEHSWKKASVKKPDKVKAEILDTVQKSIKRVSKEWANGAEYEKQCTDIGKAVIKQLGL